MRIGSRTSRSVGVLLALTAALSACGAPTTTDDGSLVLADGYELGGYNPIAGYGAAGEAKMYDGLLRLRGGPGLPEFDPALAIAPPVAATDATVWTVDLRPGVKFSDGTDFDAADVVATYRAVLDPTSASEVRSSYEMIERVDAVDSDTVRFTLRYPYAAFPTKLLIGIVPSEAVATPGPAAESPLNTAPVGTGPYRLTELTPERAVLVANEDYWDGPPAVRKVTLVYVPDDNTRAQRMAAGELDGTTLPPLLARTFADRAGMTVSANTSADWRGVSLPSGHPVTGDPAVRRALNLAVDRRAVIDNVLGGYGRPAYTPIPEVYGEAHNPAATFDFDRERAAALLDAAGWRPGPDGIRVRDGQRAAFTVMYKSTDTLRRDLAQAFASDARRIGIEVDLEGLSWDRIEPRVERDAILLGGGDEPYDPDTQAYKTLHSAYLDPAVGSVYDNASRHADPAVDAALDRARRSTDPAARAAAYRDVQSAYIADPSYVFLAFLDHTYVTRDSNWVMSGPVLEPHTHGVAWGPWWSLHTWTRRP
ncbi:ABC transporter substrate-binding protein [Nocardia otitidiscaviarum]|uniref:ABC transporter substrate-binding protein n=1 Tax=Nocardia otitidiscaviarum TaxID=1823 RepID=UPI001893093C|nr:ABC transporter substrate-binding protein [Nocardia otitidiscaviarum]MBF6182052.1 ABC transporter substrate-binding protein [Nocardia otitidiscaviarum]